MKAIDLFAGAGGFPLVPPWLACMLSGRPITGQPQCKCTPTITPAPSTFVKTFSKRIGAKSLHMIC